MRRGQSGLSGIIAVDKPSGMTSHDVVNRVRRMTGERRVGHAGTLDPMATGLMLICIGAATRLSQYLADHDKSYTARILFGFSTDTDDRDGRVIAGSSTSAETAHEVVASLDAQEVLHGIEGEQLQLPPAFSAIKKNGVVAYKAAREGKAIELEPRPVTVHEARFAGAGTERIALSDAGGRTVEAALAYWDVDFTVSKGTYIRALARDLGKRLDCGAFLGALRRTGVASTEVAAARSLEKWEQVFASGEDIPWCDPVELLGFAQLELTADHMADVTNGRKFEAACPDGHVCCTSGGRLLALYDHTGRTCSPLAVIPGGVAGAAHRR